MKKVIMSVIMCVALMASSVVVAQDKAPKKDQPKKECCKDKKSCCKDSGKKDGKTASCCQDKAKSADKK
jgi:hypothetical protein